MGRGFRSCCFEETTSFGSPTSCSRYGFQKRPKSASDYNHNDGFIDDDEFVVLYDLFASKKLDFPYDSYAQFDLEELDESESFVEFHFGKQDIRILKEVLQIPDMITCSKRSVCDGLEGLYAVQAAFIPMQIWRHDP